MNSKLSKMSKYTTPNKTKRIEKISKITIHHSASIQDAESIARYFSRGDAQASANYIIGKDGEIVCLVPEEYRAWTSSSRWNDQKAITIEVSNSSLKPNWEISDKAMKSLIALCIDICKRYNIKPLYNGTKTGTFTFHCMFTATECPGAYIKNHINDIIDKVTKGISDGTVLKDSDTKEMKVKVTADSLNIRASASSKAKITGKITDKGIYTIVAVSGNWGKLKSGAGWISLKYTKEV